MKKWPYFLPFALLILIIIMFISINLCFCHYFNDKMLMFTSESGNAKELSVVVRTWLGPQISDAGVRGIFASAQPHLRSSVKQMRRQTPTFRHR